MNITNHRLIYLLAFIIGFLGLCYEVLATQILFRFFVETSHSISIVISSFLLGLSLGTLAYTKYFYKFKNKALFFCFFNVASALLFFIMFSSNFLNKFFFNIDYISIFFKILILSFFVILPTFFLGVFFPFFITLISKSKLLKKEKKLGFLYFYDLIGSVIGSLIAGFIFIPYIGSSKSLLFLFCIHLIISLFLFKSKKIWFVYLSLIFLLFLLFFVDVNMVNMNSFDKKQTEPIFEEESLFGTVSVLKQKDGILKLAIGPSAQCSTKGFFDNNISEMHFVDLALKQFSRPIKVLNIGLGCGFTAAAIANHNYTYSLDVVEINPVVVTAASFFSEYNENILNNDEVNIIIDDGFFFLRDSKNKYDVVAIDIENPLIVHSSNLYTLESFEYVHNVLSEDGIFVLWAYNGPQKYVDILYHTLDKVFQHVYFKRSGVYNDLYFFASDRELNYDSLLLTLDDLEKINIVKNKNDVPLNTIDQRTINRIIFR